MTIYFRGAPSAEKCGALHVECETTTPSRLEGLWPRGTAGVTRLDASMGSLGAPQAPLLARGGLWLSKGPTPLFSTCSER
jgi:hypothetical protein